MRAATRRLLRRNLGQKVTEALAVDTPSAITLVAVPATLGAGAGWVNVPFVDFSANEWASDESWFSFDGAEGTVRVAPGHYSGWVSFRATGEVIAAGPLLTLVHWLLVNSTGSGVFLPETGLVVTPDTSLGVWNCHMPFATFVASDVSCDGDIMLQLRNDDDAPIEVEDITAHIVRLRGLG